MSKKKTRHIDNIEEQRKIVEGAFREINPPAHMGLEDEYRVYFDNIIDECPKVEWSNHKIEVVTVLARVIGQLNKESKILNDEGSVIENARGDIIENPRVRICQKYTNEIVTLRRTLAINSVSQGLQTRDIAKRRDIAKGFEVKALQENDGLIAQPGNA